MKQFFNAAKRELLSGAQLAIGLFPIFLVFALALTPVVLIAAALLV